MADALIELRDALRAFAAERDWDQFHSPRNLATALAVEAAELLEPFQWLTDEQGSDLPPETRRNTRRTRRAGRAGNTTRCDCLSGPVTLRRLMARTRRGPAGRMAAGVNSGGGGSRPTRGGSRPRGGPLQRLDRKFHAHCSKQGRQAT
jgi:hypothetical protein